MGGEKQETHIHNNLLRREVTKAYYADGKNLTEKKIVKIE